MHTGGVARIQRVCLWSWIEAPTHHVWSDIVSGASDATKLRSEESNQGLLRRDAANQMHSKLPRRLFIPFLQSLPFNAKYGIKSTGGHLQTIMARLPARRPDGAGSDKSSTFAAKEIEEFRLISLFSCFGSAVRCL